MATTNPYIALYKADGVTRITEFGCPGHDTVFIEPSGYLLIPDASETISSPIPFTIKTSTGFKTLGAATLVLVNSATVKNRWRFSLTTDFTSSVWGANLVVPGDITTTPKTIYVQARAIGTVSDVTTATADCIEDDVSLHIAIEATIVRS